MISLESIPVIGYVYSWLIWFWDYLYAFTMLGKWVIKKELLTPHFPINIQEFHNRSGQVAVITGGGRGIGSTVIKKLLQVNMNVIMGCRNPADGESLLKRIRASGVNTGSLEALQLDMSSLKSVRAFATRLQFNNTPIHLLINNAGVMAVPFKETADGLETHFQVNYLSHFLLTHLLLPIMASTAAAERNGFHGRIVNVSSSAQYDGKVSFNDLQSRKRYNPFVAYFNSKWMQVVSTRFLDARLQAEGVRVRVNSLHPGVVGTDLVLHVPYFGKTLSWITKTLLMTPDQGGDEVIYVALSPEVENKGGEYFVHRKICPIANDTPRIQKRLYEISCELTSIENKYTN